MKFCFKNWSHPVACVVFYLFGLNHTLLTARIWWSLPDAKQIRAWCQAPSCTFSLLLTSRLYLLNTEQMAMLMKMMPMLLFKDNGPSDQFSVVHSIDCLVPDLYNRMSTNRHCLSKCYKNSNDLAWC